MKKTPKHPIQPLAKDDQGVMRFKPNKIVQHLLDHGGIDLNQLATMDFTADDREQFAQLIGYSLSGFSELSYVTEETYAAAALLSQTKKVTEEQARIVALEKMLEEAREGIRTAAVAIFRIHPDDLHE